MAKGLNILTAGNNVSLADGGLKFSKRMLLEKIEEHESFKTLFAIDENVLERIVQSMKTNGFDNSQPIHIWKYEGHVYLIDGYTRFLACKKAGISMVPIFEHNFESYEEAYKYVLGLQVNRRNLSSAELFEHVEKLLGTNFIQTVTGDKASVIADTLGVSRRRVLRAMSVEKNADEELKENVKSGEVSVYEAYNKIHKKDEVENEDKGVHVEKKYNGTAMLVANYVLARILAGKSAEEIVIEENLEKLLENPRGFRLPIDDLHRLRDANIILGEKSE